MSFERSLSWILQLENYPLWKNEGALKHLWKLTGKHVTRIYILMKLHTSLFLEYFQMFPFETTSIKAWKLYIVCIICSSQQIRWLRGWNGRWASLSAHRRKKDNVCILGKKLHFFYLIIVLQEWNQAWFELFDKIFVAFQCGVGCEFAISMAYKERYNWSMNCVLLDRKLLDFIS